RIEAAVAAQPGVVRVERTRVRESGPHAFVDMTVIVAAGLSLEAAHDITQLAEEAVREEAPGADVTIHFEPQATGERDAMARIRCVAAAHALPVHAVEVIDAQPRADAPHELMVELHVELEGHMTLGAAHARVTAFEEALRAELGPLHVATHMEPAQDMAAPAVSRVVESPRIEAEVQAAADAEPGVHDCHHVHIRRHGEDISLSFHCRMAPETSVTEAHRASAALEARLRASLPELGRVVVHMEPEQG
ncbi:MAG TPA: cation transporter, partial [Desulfovibrio sp.]|nr:cation transporter [Desulfovibrio sp.]